MPTLIDVISLNPVLTGGLFLFVLGLVFLAVGMKQDDLLLRTQRFGFFLALVGVSAISISILFGFR